MLNIRAFSNSTNDRIVHTYNEIAVVDSIHTDSNGVKVSYITSKLYSVDNHVLAVFHYVNGIKDGEEIWFKSNGSTATVTQWINGNFVKRSTYSDGLIIHYCQVTSNDMCECVMYNNRILFEPRATSRSCM